MWCAFFLLFPVKKCTKKGNHLCSSLLNLKMTFHQHSPFLISNCEIWSHCFKILVPSVWPNHFFCPTFFRTMNDKSPSSCVSRNDVANLGCDVASVISTILCFAYLLEKPRAFDPRGRVALTPRSEISLTLWGEIKMTPEKQSFFRGFFVVLRYLPWPVVNNPKLQNQWQN